ncbi:MAG: HAD family hydrolase [Pseudomonadota bacterium]
MTLKALIFDVDGTLADTEDGHRKSFNLAFHENGLDWNWDVALYDKLLQVTGGKERIKHFIDTCLPGFSKPADYDGFVKNLHAVKTLHYTSMLAEGRIPLRPGIRQLISDARQRGIRLAIATTTTPQNVTALLHQGLGPGSEDIFEVIGCGDIVPHKKPAPDIYFWVLEKMRLSPAECIALEDSENGLRSSLAAGIKTFITTNAYTRGQNFSGAAAIYEDLSDLDAFYQAAGLAPDGTALPKKRISA